MFLDMLANVVQHKYNQEYLSGRRYLTIVSRPKKTRHIIIKYLFYLRI